jgi:hypothetical protein
VSALSDGRRGNRPWVTVSRWVLIALFGLGVPIGVFLVPEQGIPSILLPIVAYTGVGALVTTRRPQNPVGWVFLGVGGVTGLGSIASALSSSGIDSTSPSWWAVTVAVSLAGTGIPCWVS